MKIKFNSDVKERDKRIGKTHYQILPNKEITIKKDLWKHFKNFSKEVKDEVEDVK